MLKKIINKIKHKFDKSDRINKFYPYTTELEIVEEGADPCLYISNTNSLLNAVKSVNEMIFQAIEIEGFDKAKLSFEYIISKNGEYVSGDEGELQVYAERTKEPSKYVKWGNKEPHIFSLDRNNTELIFSI